MPLAAVITSAPEPLILGSCQDITFREEPFSSLKEEGAALFEMHWREASADLSVPLAVAWDKFEALERMGLEVCVTARKRGQLIGYLVYVLYPHLHYRTMLVGDSDNFFLDPAHRNGWIGIRLFREAERLLVERDVQEVWGRMKLHVRPGRGHRHLGVLFRYLGYRPVELFWRKRIS